MRIDPSTLIAVAQDFFARYDAMTLNEARTDLAFEAVGMLRAFVQGYKDEEEMQVRQYEATAHIPEDENSCIEAAQAREEAHIWGTEHEHSCRDCHETFACAIAHGQVVATSRCELCWDLRAARDI